MLRRALRGLAKPRGAVAWLEGEAGIGKTTLLDAFLSAARATDALILCACSDDLPEPPPLHMMATLVDSMVSAHRPDVTGLDSHPIIGQISAAPVAAAAEQLVALAAALCAARPLILVADDLHTADEASLLVWYRLSRCVDRMPLLLVSTCRPVPYRPRLVQLREAIRQRGGHIVTVNQLTAPEVDRVAADILGAPPGPIVSRYLAAVGGNPRCVRGLLEDLTGTGLTKDECVERGDEEISTGQTVFARHLLEAVSGPTRHIVEVAALLGPEFDPAELGVVAATPPLELAASLASAINRGILRPAGHRLAFSHDIAQLACAAAVSPSARAAFHLAAARALIAHDAAAVAVAHHLVDAGELPLWAATWLESLPESTLLTEPTMFATLLNQALASVTDRRDRAQNLAVRLARLDYWLGHYERAAGRAVSAANALSEGAVCAEMRRLAVRARLHGGQPQAAAEVCRHAEAVLMADSPDAARDLRLEAWHAVALAEAGHRAEGQERARWAFDKSARASDVVAAASAVHALVRVGHCSLVADAIVAHRDALEDDPESNEMRALLHADWIELLIQRGEAEAVIRAVAQIPELVPKVDPQRAAQLRMSAGDAAFRLGRWDEAMNHVGGAGSPWAGKRAGLAAVIALLRQEPAIDTDDRAESEDRFGPYVAEARAIRAESAGDMRGALDLRVRILELSLERRPCRLHGMEHLVRLAQATGDAVLAVATVERCEEVAAAEYLPAQVATALTVRAMVDQDPVALRAVSGRFRGLGSPLQQGHALEEAAVLHGRAGDRVDAGRALREAARVYRALGAEWDLARADTRLRARGVRRRVSVHRPTSGWDALTPAEVRVARLVVRGLSNPDIAAELFVTRHTVQTHLSHILGKLGVRSRLDVVRAAARHPDEAMAIRIGQHP